MRTRYRRANGDRGREAAGAPLSRARMVVVCLALLLEGMSASGINVQIAVMRDDIGIGPAELALVASAFLIAYAGLLPIAGSLADTLDRRRVFLIGIALFGVGCIVCAFAPDAGLLITGRFVQGAGAALSAPAALALITEGLPAGAARNRAVALYGAMGAVGFSLGLVVPGVVVTLLGWRASFLVSIPVVLAVLGATWTIRARRTRSRERPDVVGAVLLTAALMLGVHLIGAIGGLPAIVAGVELAAFALVVVALFARRGVRGFPSGVASSPGVRAACLALAGIFAGVVASMYVLSLGLVESGATALIVALVILPQPLAFSLLAGTGARLVTRIGAWRTVAIGAAVLIASLVWLGAVGLAVPPWVGVLPAMVGVGCALALAFPAVSVAAVDTAPEEARATTAGLLTTAQNIGGAVGIALVTTAGLVPVAGEPIGIQPAMFASAMFVVVAVAGAAGIGAVALRRVAAAGAPR
ncbi:MFS transporter [Agromyces laixinhei]|uniref:MFS transporter n=1 Tax=Agromyces laixinhei TaxID=2585717 RepID=UPI0011175F08|nr:MFS transporter [Agromyces laixinhei]